MSDSKTVCVENIPNKNIPNNDNGEEIPNPNKDVSKEPTRVTDIVKQTENRFLNMYDLKVMHRNGKIGSYYVASRSETIDGLMAKTHSHKPTAVLLFGLLGDKLVLERQFRYPLDDYLYELPAGLIEDGEDLREAAVREAFEETGLTFTPNEEDYAAGPFYMSPGMTDEACSILFGTYEGEPTSANEEDDEDIQVILADRDECRRILAEEKVSITCAFQLMRFLEASAQ